MLFHCCLFYLLAVKDGYIVKLTIMMSQPSEQGLYVVGVACLSQLIIVAPYVSSICPSVF